MIAELAGVLAALLLGVAAFVMVLRGLGAQAVAGEVLRGARTSLSVMTDKEMDDAAKEAHLRRASLTMFRSFAVIFGIGALALALPAAIVWAGAALGAYGLDRAVAVAMGWPFLLGSTAAVLILWGRLGAPRVGEPDAEGARPEVAYGPLDQALHAYAFARPGRQIALARVEDRLFAGAIDPGAARRPIFLTSLPRAGTTILLEVLARQPQLASATYRQMPFTLAPLLWGRAAGAFRKAGARRERAHGDGIEIDADSPEAFEEMMWRAFWPDHYGPDGIATWNASDRDPDFEAFFARHRAKIVATKAGAARYLSKNNANVARLALLPRIAEEAAILIPVRDPFAQAASLRRQHLRFLDLHAREPFARTYMEGVGHLEFGAALSPIAFGGRAFDPEGAHETAFWLDYWIAAYEEVLSRAPADAVFVDHDALSARPARHLPWLAEALGLDPAALVAEAGRFRASRPVEVPADVPQTLRARAAELHDALRRRTLGALPARVSA